MDGFRPTSIEVAPLQADGSLYGFMLIGRWPNDTVEWARFLVLAVQMAAVPGLLPTSTVFRVREELISAGAYRVYDDPRDLLKPCPVDILTVSPGTGSRRGQR